MKLTTSPKTSLVALILGLAMAVLSSSAFAGSRRSTPPPPPAGSTTGVAVSLP